MIMMTTRRVSGAAALTAVLALLVLPATSAAQAANERPVRGEGLQARNPEASSAIDQLKSPYCPGLMLEVCPSPGGQALRDTLQMLADDGWNADQIVDWVVANHGEEYRAMPKRSGASLLLAWVIPPLGVLGGLVMVLVALRRMRAARPTRAPVLEDLSDEDEERLREAVRALDAEEEATFF
jgi:cytochrome c-type biogenesis protein CcmH